MTADQLRKSILQQAIQGKLVPQDPNDEPASVLLERIGEEKARLVEEKKIKKEKNPSVIFRGEDNSYYEKFTLSGEVKCIDEEIPFEIPNGWEWCRLGDITSITGGKRVPVGYSLTNQNTGYKYIRVADMKQYSVRNNDVHYISKEIYSLIKNYTISKDDLYITVAGTIGVVGEIPIEFDGANLTENANKIVFTQLNKKCLMYLLSSDYLQAQIKNCTTKVGQPKLAIIRIQNFLLPLPPLKEQQRIVEKIEELIPHIEHYGKAQTELDLLNRNIKEQLKKSVLQYAIEGKLVPQDETEGTAEELLLQIQKERQKLYEENKLKKKGLEHSIIFKGEDNKYYENIGKNVICIDEEIPFEIPKNWRWCRVRDLGLTETGTTPPKSNPNFFGDHIPFLSPANIQQNRIVNENQWLSKEGMLYGRVVPCNSILQVCIGGSIGKCAIVNKSVTFNQQINSITPILCEPKFLYYYLLSNTFFLAMIEKSTGTATPIINKGNWERLLFPLAPLAEQQRIVESIDAIFRCIEN